MGGDRGGKWWQGLGREVVVGETGERRCWGRGLGGGGETSGPQETGKRRENPRHPPVAGEEREMEGRHQVVERDHLHGVVLVTEHVRHLALGQLPPVDALAVRAELESACHVARVVQLQDGRSTAAGGHVHKLGEEAVYCPVGGETSTISRTARGYGNSERMRVGK